MEPADNIKIMRCYEVFSGDQIIGRAQISDKPEPGQDINTRCVTVIKLNKEYRRRGIATRLYQTIEDDLEARGLRLVESSHQTDDAVAFWETYREARKVRKLR